MANDIETNCQDQNALNNPPRPRGLKISDLPDNAQAAGRAWDRALNWRWVDAVTWIATRDPDMMALARGYRFYARDNLAPENVEGASRTAIRDNIGRKHWEDSARNLEQALEDGRLVATDIASGRQLPVWVPAPIANHLVGTDWIPIPEIFLSAPAVMLEWPAPAACAKAAPNAEEVADDGSPVLAASSSGAIIDCTAWLVSEFASYRDASLVQKPKWLNKGDYMRIATEERYPGRLAGRGFRKAWETATKDFPERSVSGPKTKAQ